MAAPIFRLYQFLVLYAICKTCLYQKLFRFLQQRSFFHNSFSLKIKFLLIQLHLFHIIHIRAFLHYMLTNNTFYHFYSNVCDYFFIEFVVQSNKNSMQYTKTTFRSILLPKVVLLCNIKIYAYGMPSSVSCGTSYSVSFEPGIA